MRSIRTALALAALGVIAIGATAVGTHEQARAGTALVRGWNNISYFGESRPPAEAFAGIGGQYSSIYRWNATTQSYEIYAPSMPAFGATLTQVTRGDAVWVNLTADSAVLSSSATTGHVAIAASTFTPTNDLAIYEKTFNQLSPVGTDDASVRYYAPVIIPDGATITSMTVAFEAASPASVQARLDFTPIANGTDVARIYKLVEVLSTAGASPQTAQAFAHTVDNSANVYFLVVDLVGGAGARLRGVSVAYTGG